MLVLLSALAATLMGAALVRYNRPLKTREWLGSAAVYFMLGLAALAWGFIALLLPEQEHDLKLMLQQLCLYAGLPLIACLELSAVAKRQWSRAVWGRILLAIAATFELCRRANMLEHMLLATLFLGAVALLINAYKKPWGLGWLQAGIWIALLIISWTQALLLPALTLFALALMAAFTGHELRAKD